MRYFLTAAVMLLLASPTAEAHEPEELLTCQVEDSIGLYSFPVLDFPELLELCGELGGVPAIVPDPGPRELVQWMLEVGLYNPWVMLDVLQFRDTDVE